MKRALVIANADAGTSTQSAVRQAVGRLRLLGVDVDERTTESADDLDAVLDSRGDRDVVVAGGDGSLHAVVAALAGRGELDGPALGLIPLGTGNDFARSTGVPLDPDAAAAVCVEGVLRPVDVLVDDDGGTVVNAANLGIGAEASRWASSLKPRLGPIAYVVGAAAAGMSARGLRLRVEADGEALTDGATEVLQVGIGNGRFVGGGTPLAPHAQTDDGQVDVVVSLAVGPFRRFAYALAVRLRRHLDRPDVVWTSASTVRVSGDPYWCSADGELSGPLRDRTWTVRPAALQMWLPRRSPD
jgi:YegS/Rv2252/BmrU family lipid kinase